MSLMGVGIDKSVPAYWRSEVEVGRISFRHTNALKQLIGYTPSVCSWKRLLRFQAQC